MLTTARELVLDSLLNVSSSSQYNFNMNTSPTVFWPQKKWEQLWEESDLLVMQLGEMQGNFSQEKGFSLHCNLWEEEGRDDYYEHSEPGLGLVSQREIITK